MAAKNCLSNNTFKFQTTPFLRRSVSDPFSIFGNRSVVEPPETSPCKETPWYRQTYFQICIDTFMHTYLRTNTNRYTPEMTVIPVPVQFPQDLGHSIWGFGTPKNPATEQSPESGSGLPEKVAIFFIVFGFRKEVWLIQTSFWHFLTFFMFFTYH